MGLKSFNIVFDKSDKTFYCGEAVTGRIKLIIDSPKKIRGIVLKCVGEATVHFTKCENYTGSDGKHHTRHVSYTANESYFENKSNLIGGPNDDITLQAGEHCYPFHLILPPNLPSSFEGKHGYVRYTIKVTVDRPWNFNHEAKAAYSVISPLDLNLSLPARNPVKNAKEKIFGCCCCKSNPLTLIVSLPVTGYVNGQQIPITIEVDNGSDKNLSKVVCTLMKQVSYHASSPNHRTDHSEHEIAEVTFDGVPGNGSQTSTKPLIVPSVPPSNLSNCNIIDVKYELKIVGKISGFHSNINMTVPVILGTIPLFGLPPVVPGTAAQPAQLVSANAPVWSNTMDLPPPYFGHSNYPPSIPGYPQGEKNPGCPPSPMRLSYDYGGPTPGFHGVSNLGYLHAPNSPGFIQLPNNQNFSPGPNSSGYTQLPTNPDYLQPLSDPGCPPGVNYSDLHLPTYAESMFGAKNIQNSEDNNFIHGDLNFAPRYPVYNFQPSAPL